MLPIPQALISDRARIRPCKWKQHRSIHDIATRILTIGLTNREDCYHLSTALPNLSHDNQHEDYNKSLEILRSSLSESIFRPFAEKRQPRTAVLVKGARAMGEKRVAVGSEKGRQRDEAVAQSYEGDAEAVVAKFEGLLSQPFN